MPRRGYGYVHKRAEVVPPEAINVGFRESAVGLGYASDGFTGTDCGGEPGTILVPVYSNSSMPCSVRVTAVGGGYISGVEYEPIDLIVEFPGEEYSPGVYRSEIPIVLNNGGNCPYPHELGNEVILLELSQPIGCDIGGAMITIGVNSYNLYAQCYLFSSGI